MYTRNTTILYLLASLSFVGCSRGPSRIQPPDISPESSAAEALNLYDANKDGALDKTELANCPAMLAELAAYDVDSSGSVSREEIVGRISGLLKRGVGLSRLNCNVSLNGRGLENASVEFEPEAYLGDDIQKAFGTTNARGVAQMAIPAEELPEDQRDLKGIHYGTYKVRISHPTIKLPPKYNVETTLGYESRPGDPFARFNLTTP
jgi:hypothetical protein